MAIQPFKLERYFGKYEFKVQYLLSPSDCEALKLDELLQMATPEGRGLWKSLNLAYTESQGHPRLREEVAGLYQSVTPEGVLIAVPEEAIFIATNTLLEPGDHVIAVSPAYQSLYEIARSMGCEVTPWQVEASADGWHFDLNRLESSLTPRTRLLVLNFPHNPTGCLPTRSELDAILDLARRHDLIVFSDEMYRLLEYNPAQRLPAVCDIYEKGVSLSGLSKSFALPGLRLGWLATRNPDWIERFLTFKDYTTICSSAPSEVLAIIALQAKDQIVARNLEIIRANLPAAQNFFKEFPAHFSWLSPQAGSIAFPRWNGAGPVEAFCQLALDRKGIMIVPGSIFDFPGNYFRVGLGRRNLPDVLNQLGQILDV
jgi:aspartate/methionine/tyrosine aminotransferase